MEDLTYDELVTFISDKDYGPRIKNISDAGERKSEKKKLRSKSKGITSVNGMLYKDTQRILRKHETAAVIHNMHAGKYSGGHLGRDKTLNKIKEHYYWKGMKDEIRNYVRDCDICCRVTIAPPKSAPPLHPIPVPEKVWSLVGIDIVGPMETTANGNKYIVAMTDHFSKFSLAAAIPDKTTASVAKFLLHNISLFGPMDSLISDQGKEFTSKVIDHLTSELEIDHRISSSYHPQTNGQRERDNRTLKEMLQKATNENGSDWDVVLDSVMFAYRSSVHDSTKHTPFEVMFGRKVRIVKTSLSSLVFDSCPLSQESVTVINKNKKETCKAVGENIKKAQKRQKKNYDAKNNAHKAFEVGQKVLIKNASKIRRFGGKLVPRWVGPYVVIQALTKGRVKLQNFKNQKTLSNTYHSSNLKLYTASSPKQEKADTEHPKTASSPEQENKDTESQTKVKSEDPCKDLKQKKNETEELILTKEDSPRKRKFSPPTRQRNIQLCRNGKITFKKQPNFRSGLLNAPKNIHKIVGDGNCFFRALSYCISGSQNDHLKLRDHIVSHMSTKKISDKLENYLNEDVTNYVKRRRIRDSGVWATDAEIMGAASLLQVDIFVYTLSGDTRKWLKYPAGFDLDSKTPSALYIRNYSDHFDVVLAC